MFTYKYSTNNNTIISQIDGNGTLLRGKYEITKDNTGNIIAEKDSGFRYNNGMFYYTSNSNITYTYDAKKCPFYKIYPQRRIGLDYELIATEDIFPFSGFFQQNNTTSQRRITFPVSGGIDNYYETFKYTYNNNNLPVSVVYTDELFGDTYKGIY